MNYKINESESIIGLGSKHLLHPPNYIKCVDYFCTIREQKRREKELNKLITDSPYILYNYKCTSKDLLVVHGYNHNYSYYVNIVKELESRAISNNGIYVLNYIEFSSCELLSNGHYISKDLFNSLYRKRTIDALLKEKS